MTRCVTTRTRAHTHALTHTRPPKGNAHRYLGIYGWPSACEVDIIASDGIYYEEPRSVRDGYIFVSIGSRADLLIQCDDSTAGSSTTIENGEPPYLSFDDDGEGSTYGQYGADPGWYMGDLFTLNVQASTDDMSASSVSLLEQVREKREKEPLEGPALRPSRSPCPISRAHPPRPSLARSSTPLTRESPAPRLVVVALGTHRRAPRRGGERSPPAPAPRRATTPPPPMLRRRRPRRRQ